MIGKIYLITNTVNGKQYIGQTWGTLEERWQSHVYQSKHRDYAISKAIRKYGEDAFTIYSLLECVDVPQGSLDVMEVSLISVYDTFHNGYNETTGGKGGKHSEETKRKQSEAVTGEKNHRYGKHYSDERKQEMRDSMKGEKNPNYGKPAWNRGKPRSKETKRKIREATLGKNKGKPAWNKGKSPSAETRAKMSDAAKVRTPWNKGKCMKELGIPTQKKHDVEDKKEQMIAMRQSGMSYRKIAIQLGIGYYIVRDRLMEWL